MTPFATRFVTRADVAWMACLTLGGWAMILLPGLLGVRASWLWWL